MAGGINTFGYVGGNPVNWIDPKGLLAKWDHWDITYASAIANGMCECQAVALADAVVGVDTGTQSSSPEDTIHHNMVGDGQTVDQANTAADNLIKDSNEPLESRVHAAQDGAAPWHRGREWNGFRDPFNSLAHLLMDAFPWGTVLEDARKATDSLIKENVDCLVPECNC